MTVPSDPLLLAWRGYRGAEFLIYNGRANFTATETGGAFRVAGRRGPSRIGVSPAGSTALETDLRLLFGALPLEESRVAGRGPGGETGAEVEVSLEFGSGREITGAVAIGFMRVSRLRLFLGLIDLRGKCAFLSSGGITGLVVFAMGGDLGGRVGIFWGLAATDQEIKDLFKDPDGLWFQAGLLAPPLFQQPSHPD